MRVTEVLVAIDEILAKVGPETHQALAAVLCAKAAQLLAGVPGTTPGPVEADKNLSVDQAARQLGVSRDWLYKNKLPFKVRIGRRVLFSARGLERWNSNRREHS
jgi:excisionase family DNA binding protein